MLPQVQPGRDGRRRLSLILYLDYLGISQASQAHSATACPGPLSSAAIISCPLNDAVVMPESQRASMVREM